MGEQQQAGDTQEAGGLGTGTPGISQWVLAKSLFPFCASDMKRIRDVLSACQALCQKGQTQSRKITECNQVAQGHKSA